MRLPHHHGWGDLFTSNGCSARHGPTKNLQVEGFSPRPTNFLQVPCRVLQPACRSWCVLNLIDVGKILWYFEPTRSQKKVYAIFPSTYKFFVGRAEVSFRPPSKVFDFKCFLKISLKQVESVKGLKHSDFISLSSSESVKKEKI